MTRALVYGLAVAGASTVRALTARGVDVVVADDEATPERRARADELGVEFVEAPGPSTIRALVDRSDLVCPSPGVPEHHPVIVAATAGEADLVSEIELAYRWEQERPGGPRPLVAITGTDGKTTTTLLAAHILRTAGLRVVDAGNTETPLVDAIDLDLDVIVVECTSFRLAWTPTFRAEAAVWLNLAPDHLNWHGSMATYEAAKARIFLNQRPDDVAIGLVDDPVVMAHLRRAPARTRTFGLRDADYHLDDDLLVGPAGAIAERSSMARSLPHDVTNALAAAASVIEVGLADADAIATALATFTGPRHRLESIGSWAGIEWFDDSKATTPHAAAAAIRSFDRVVLLAGGYDKGVDLTPMTADAHRVHAVIAFGATAAAVATSFSMVPQVETVPDLPAAVAAAARLARPGDTVLLSPGCASLDQYPGFEARGDHFRELVQGLSPAADATAETASTPGGTP